MLLIQTEFGLSTLMPRINKLYSFEIVSTPTDIIQFHVVAWFHISKHCDRFDHEIIDHKAGENAWQSRK